MIGKAKDTKAFFLQEFGAGLVMGSGLFCPMLVPVEFNYEPGLEAQEVCNIRTDRLLPPKLESGELPAAQGEP